MSKGLAVAVLLIVGMIGFLAMKGYTWADARRWLERQSGEVRGAAPDLKAVPYPAYSPVVAPVK